MAFKLVVSDPKTRKSYQKEVSGEGILGKKIGEKFNGNVAGIEGYELEVTGGSDDEGFPMRKDVEGSGRKKILLSGGVGFKPSLEGQRKRKSIRGNTVSEDIAQVNCKVTKEGKEKLDKLFAGEKKAEGEEKSLAEELQEMEKTEAKTDRNYEIEQEKKKQLEESKNDTPAEEKPDEPKEEQPKAEEGSEKSEEEKKE